MEGIISRPNIIDIRHETISRILLDAAINSEVEHIGKSHPRVMQSQRIQLTDGRYLLLKVAILTQTRQMLHQYLIE